MHKLVASMARIKIPQKIFKDCENISQFSCSECRLLLEDPVQLSCGHRLCKCCADELVSNVTLKCPESECNEEIAEEDGAKVLKKL